MTLGHFDSGAAPDRRGHLDTSTAVEPVGECGDDAAVSRVDCLFDLSGPGAGTDVGLPAGRATTRRHQR